MRTTSCLCFLLLLFALVRLPAAEPDMGAGSSGPATYEGRTAAEWSKVLEKATAPATETQKAKHALVRIGVEALPELVRLIEQAKEDSSAVSAADTLGQIKIAPAAVPVFLPLLKHRHWAARRAAVRALAPLVEQSDAVAAALKGALKDRDKAVVEAAEGALETYTRKREQLQLQEEALRKKEADLAEKRARTQACLDRSLRLMAEKRWDEAHRLAQDALRLEPSNPAALDIIRHCVKAFEDPDAALPRKVVPPKPVPKKKAEEAAEHF